MLVSFLISAPQMFPGQSEPVMAQEHPDFEPAACPEHVDADSCGYVTVPENRQHPGRTIKLYVMINRADGEDPEPDPVFVLSGGPGEQAIVYYESDWLFADRDVVYFDQRGNGYSQPALECPEQQRVYESNPAFAQLADQSFEALGVCGKRYLARGIDLSAYNATESAHDIEAIRKALGYGKINLLGVSYGTRLAQEAMRAHSDSLRAVIMDSVLPADINLPVNLPVTIEAALQTLFKNCADEPDCDQAFPDLERKYLELLSHLDAGAKPPDDKSWPIAAAEWQLSLVRELYSPHAIDRVPFRIETLYSGEIPASRDPARDIKLHDMGLSGMSLGSFITVTCLGETAFTTPQAIEQGFAKLPQWREALGNSPEISSPRLHQLCRDWGLSEPSGRENEAVKSDVPTLLLAGRLDPVTPPRFLAHVADHLANVYPFVLTAGSHALLYSHSCAGKLAEEFMHQPEQRPTPDCAEEDTEYWGRESLNSPVESAAAGD